MAIKQSLTIRDENLNEEYIIVGQSGVYCQEDYHKGEDTLLFDDDISQRFILIDLWQLGVFGSEMVKQTWDEKEQKNAVMEKDIDKFVNETIEYINRGLFDEIKEQIMDEVKSNEEDQYLVETVTPVGDNDE